MTDVRFRNSGGCGDSLAVHGTNTYLRANTQQSAHLEGHMGFWELLSTVLAFSAPVSVVSGYIPYVIVFDGIGAPLVFLVSMTLLLLFAVGFTTMSRHLPNPGAFYAYITAGLGRVLGLGAALLAMLGYLLLGFCIFPYFAVNANALVTVTFHGPEVPWYWYALLCGITSGALSYRRIDLSAKVLAVVMIFEVLIILIFDAAVFFHGGPQGRSLQPFSWGSFTSGAVGISVLFAVTCFLGFEATAIFRDEVKRPRDTIPRATYVAVLLIGLFYAVAAWMIITAFGADHAAAAARKDPPSMFPAAMGEFVGKGSVDVVHVLLMSSLFAAILSVQNILARYVFCLGGDGALPRILGRVHPRHHSPYIAAVLVSAMWFLLGLIFVFHRTDPTLLYARVAGVGGFAVLILMLLTSVAVVVFFHRANHVNDSTPWHTVIAPTIAAVGLALIVYLAVANFPLLIGGSKTDAILLQILTWGVLLLGMALAFVYRYKRPDVYRRIGHQSL